MSVASPFADIKSGFAFGVPLEHFACIQCGGAPTGGIFMQFRNEAADEKPSMIFGYMLCARCGAQYWEEAGTKAFSSLRDSLQGLTP